MPTVDLLIKWIEAIVGYEFTLRAMSLTGERKWCGLRQYVGGESAWSAGVSALNKCAGQRSICEEERLRAL